MYKPRSSRARLRDALDSEDRDRDDALQAHQAIVSAPAIAFDSPPRSASQPSARRRHHPSVGRKARRRGTHDDDDAGPDEVHRPAWVQGSRRSATGRRQARTGRGARGGTDTLVRWLGGAGRGEKSACRLKRGSARSARALDYSCVARGRGGSLLSPFPVILGLQLARGLGPGLLQPLGRLRERTPNRRPSPSPSARLPVPPPPPRPDPRADRTYRQVAVAPVALAVHGRRWPPRVQVALARVAGRAVPAARGVRGEVGVGLVGLRRQK